LAFVGVRSLWIISRISETVDYSPESSLPRVAWSQKTLKKKGKKNIAGDVRRKLEAAS
jgi:hypothetical protein